MKKYDLRKLFLLAGLILMSQFFIRDFVHMLVNLSEFLRGLGAGITIVVSASLLNSKRKFI